MLKLCNTLRISVFLSIAFLISISPIAQASSTPPQYTLTDLGNLGTTGYGQPFAEAFGINNVGHIVGFTTTTLPDPNGQPQIHAFFYDGTMHDLGVIVPFSNPLAIATCGAIAGSASNMNGSSDAFLFQNACHDLGQGGFVSTAANATNDRNQLAGTVNIQNADGSKSTHAMLYDSQFHDLGLLQYGTVSYGMGIDYRARVIGVGDAPQVVTIGGIPFPVWGTHAFLNDGTMHDLGALPGAITDFSNGIYALAMAINGIGDIAGASSTNITDLYGDTHINACIFHYNHIGGETISDLGVLPGAYYAEGDAINKKDQVVGYSLSQNQPGIAAFVYTGGHMYDLNTLIPPGSGFYLTNAQGINDSGQIVGYGSVSSQTHAFLLTPVVH